MKYQKWNVAPPCHHAQRALEEDGVPSLLAAVLATRGIRTVEQAAALLSPEDEPMLDPFALKDMDKAVERVKLALKRAERIAVYGDYDVDGITATCLLTLYLRGLGGDVVSYIPGRLEEGYGLNREAVTALAEQGVKLLITVDCGITAVDEVRYAASLGVEVVITDHHACKETLPPAVAVVDPHRPDCTYPFKGLAGVGVALKLAMAVAGAEGAGEVFRRFRDLAAVGTVADVMPMTGENRAIVSLGLRDMNPPVRLGLAKLVECAGIGDKLITSVSVGYTIAPRINASGRMGCAMAAAELILTDDPARAELLAQELCELNRERQLIESEIFRQSAERLGRAPQKGVIVLADEGWHQGVVGIVASRLAEKYGCPAFMICLEKGIGKGSCRSWGGVNLFELLKGCAPLLENFGGHALAAGFTVREENIPAFAAALRRGMEEQCRGESLTAELDVDAVISPELLTVEAVEALDSLEPLGTGNPRPVLVVRGAQVQTMAQVGRGRHLKMRLETRGYPLDAIYFSADGTELGLSPGCRVDVAFYPQVSEFRGMRSVQLQVIDLCIAPTRAQMERDIYERFHRGELLTAEEARFLLPTRMDFVELWRWLERQSAVGTVVEDTVARIARGVARLGAQPTRREAPARTMLCLEVLEERGLIALNRRTDRIQITLRPVERKADLEASVLLVRLRQAAEE